MDRRFQEVNHESQENKVQTLSHEPLQKLPIHRISTTDREHAGGGKTKTGPGLHPKAQISILPPGKYQRPARFREGVDFLDPLPLSKRQFKQRLCQFQGREGSF